MMLTFAAGDWRLINIYDGGQRRHLPVIISTMRPHKPANKHGDAAVFRYITFSDIDMEGHLKHARGGIST